MRRGPGSRRTAWALVLLVLGFGAVAAVALASLGGGTVISPASQPGQSTTAARARRGATADADRGRLLRALRRGVAAAAGLGGTVEAAAMLDGWQRPLVVTSERRGARRSMRMWSISKVATMIAVLRRLGWGARPGRPLSPELTAALRGAIRRSENCRQRRVVLELQRLAGGPAGARQALAEVFAIAGAEAQVGTAVEAPEPPCVRYLEGQVELPDPLAPGVLLGTSTWRVGDAARLIEALSTGAYGRAISRRVLALMRAPKLPSREVPAGELTAPVDWGAGEALPGDPAYKAGWGGTLHGNFLAGQIALARLPGLGPVSLAVMFHPATQPVRDDPGITAAPAAIETVLDAVLAAGRRDRR